MIPKTFEKCHYVLVNGSKCKAYIKKGSVDFCFRHDPTTKEEALIASAKGGANKIMLNRYGDAIPLEKPGDVQAFIGKVTNAVWTGEMAPQVAGSLAYLCKIWLEAKNSTEFEDRLEKLEEKAEKVVKQ